MAEKRVKRGMFLIILMVLVMGVFSGTTFAATPKLNKKNVSITVGKTYHLSIKNKGKNQVSWKSSKPAIVSVNEKGQIKGLKPGKAVIQAKVGKKTLKCSVTVKAVKAKKISLNKKTATISVGETLQLKASISPKNTTNQAATWSSSNKKVVKVDSKGKITAVGAGSAKVTVMTKDGSKKKAVCKVTVKKKSSQTGTSAPKTPAFRITDGKSLIKVGETLYLSFDPDLDRAPRWQISDSRIIECVDGESGIFRGVRVGTATITCTGVLKGKTVSASLTVTVVQNGTQTNYYEREEHQTQIRKELAAARAKGPAAYIQYCETHMKDLIFGEGRSAKFVNALNSGNISDKLDVSADYSSAVRALYNAWLDKLLTESGARKTNDKLVQIMLVETHVHSLYTSGVLQYGGRAVSYGLCPTIAPLLMEGKENGSYQFGSCYAFAGLMVDAAQRLGIEAGYVRPDWGGASHRAAQVVIDGQTYIFDALWGMSDGKGEVADKRLNDACEAHNRIRDMK